MSNVVSTGGTLAEIAKRTGPDGKAALLINLLSQNNDVLDDMIWVEANDGSSHLTTVTTEIPEGTWRMINGGVAASRASTAQIRAACGMLEAFGVNDKALVDMAPDPNQYRLQESGMTLEGMGQNMAGALFYSNSLLTPSQIMGLSPYYSTLDTDAAQTANNVLDAGGRGSTNASIWIVCSGEQSFHGIYPRGSMAGASHMDLGDKYAPGRDAAGNAFLAYWDHYKFHSGLALRDWRYVVRIANIDVTSFDTPAAPNLVDAISNAMDHIPTLPAGVGAVQTDDTPTGVSQKRCAIYMNRTVRGALKRQISNKPNTWLTLDDYAGKVVMQYLGVPLRNVDRLLNTEAAVQ